MTGPAYDGELHAKLVIDSSNASEDLRRALTEVGAKNSGNGGAARVLGEDLGKEVDKGLTSEINRRGPNLGLNLATRMEKAIVARPIRLAISDSEHEIERVAANWAARLGQALSQGFIQNIGKGVFSTLTQISGSVGNVSGGGKLAVVLIPLIASLGALIIAAVHGAEALVGLLYAIPDILFAIGLQAGVLFLVFHGLTTEIAAAFSAKNAKELDAALKKMNPAVATFVKSLLPIRDLFKYLTYVAQTGFFKTLGTTLGDTIKALGPFLALAVNGISISLGGLFKTLIGFFGSPLFQQFFLLISGATQRWIDGFSKGLETLLTGFHNFAISVINSGFIDTFGKKFNNFIASIGRWFDNLAHDKKFQDWLNSIFDTIENHLLPALGSIWDAIKALVKAMDVNGFGDTLLDVVTATFETLANFLNSDIGRNGLDLIAAILINLLFLTGLLIEGFVGAFGIIATSALGLAHAVKDLWDWLSRLVDGAPAVKDAIGNAFQAIGDWFVSVGDTAARIGSDIITFLSDTFPKTVKDGLASLGHDLYTFLDDKFGVGAFVKWGKNIVDGLIAGFKHAFPGLIQAAKDGLQDLRDLFPHSPAKAGPLSGKGDPMLAGQNIINRLASGIEMATPNLSAASNNAVSNIFMPGSIAVGFHGALPTQQQAFNTGNAVGNGITTQLQATALKVRTL